MPSGSLQPVEDRRPLFRLHRLETIQLDIDDVAEPGHRHPVGKVTRGERPLHGLPREPIMDGTVVREDRIIVKLRDSVGKHTRENGQESDRKAKAQQNPLRIVPCCPVHDSNLVLNTSRRAKSRYVSRPYHLYGTGSPNDPQQTCTGKNYNDSAVKRRLVLSQRWRKQLPAGEQGYDLRTIQPAGIFVTD
jgi:hypothetical protein